MALRIGDRSAALNRRALEVMPGGNSRITVFMHPHPPYAQSGEGCRSWTWTATSTSISSTTIPR